MIDERTDEAVIFEAVKDGPVEAGFMHYLAWQAGICTTRLYLIKKKLRIKSVRARGSKPRWYWCFESDIANAARFDDRRLPISPAAKRWAEKVSPEGLQKFDDAGIRYRRAKISSEA